MANDLNATGTWKGSTENVTIELQLVQNGKSVTGTATMVIVGRHTQSHDVSGEASGLTVSLRGPVQRGSQFIFNGTYDPPPNALTDSGMTLRRS